jgi:hypothetical protein
MLRRPGTQDNILRRFKGKPAPMALSWIPALRFAAAGMTGGRHGVN